MADVRNPGAGAMDLGEGSVDGDADERFSTAFQRLTAGMAFSGHDSSSIFIDNQADALKANNSCTWCKKAGHHRSACANLVEALKTPAQISDRWAQDRDKYDALAIKFGIYRMETANAMAKKDEELAKLQVEYNKAQDTLISWDPDTASDPVLREQLQEQQKKYDKLMEDGRAHVDELNGQITDLQDNLSASNNRIRDLEQELVDARSALQRQALRHGAGAGAGASADYRTPDVLGRPTEEVVVDSGDEDEVEGDPIRIEIDGSMVSVPPFVVEGEMLTGAKFTATTDVMMRKMLTTLVKAQYEATRKQGIKLEEDPLLFPLEELVPVFRIPTDGDPLSLAKTRPDFLSAFCSDTDLKELELQYQTRTVPTGKNPLMHFRIRSIRAVMNLVEARMMEAHLKKILPIRVANGSHLFDDLLGTLISWMRRSKAHLKDSAFQSKAHYFCSSMDPRVNILSCASHYLQVISLQIQAINTARFEEEQWRLEFERDYKARKTPGASKAKANRTIGDVTNKTAQEAHKALKEFILETHSVLRSITRTTKFPKKMDRPELNVRTMLKGGK